MDRQHLNNLIKSKLDELGPWDNPELINSPMVDIQMNEAAIDVLSEVPAYIHSAVYDFSSSPMIYAGRNKWTILLPSDFIKIARFKISSWHRGIVNLINESTSAYKRQSNPYSRAGNAKPVGVLRQSSNGDKYIDFIAYNVAGQELEADTALCVNKLLPEALPLELIEPFVLRAAEKTLIVTNEMDRATAVKNEYARWITDKTNLNVKQLSGR